MKAKDLRNSILQMAVQGKLVPQDPSDEPASVLLERIREERRRLIAEGKLKAPKGGESIIYRASDGSHYEKRIDAKGRESESVCIDDEIPFEIPESWEWVRLGSITSILNGDRGKNYPAKSKLGTEGIPFVSAVNINEGMVDESQMLYMSHAQFQSLRAGKLQRGDIVFCIRGSLGKFGVFPFEEGAIASSLVIIRPFVADKILHNYFFSLFGSPLTATAIRENNNGTAQPNLAAKNLESFLYPLPPISEQERILRRLEAVLEQASAYGSLETTREKLDAELPERLRKSILQMAVQGKLVPQDPSDEPASALLVRIRAERRRLIAEGKLRMPKGGESVIYRASDGGYYEKRIDAKGRESEPVCIDDEIPFEIPDSWEWARLESLGAIVGGGTPKTSDLSLWANDDNGIPWLTPADMGKLKSKYVSRGSRFISEDGLEKSSARLLPSGSVIMSSRAPIGYLAITKAEVATNQGCKSVSPVLRDMNEWIMLSLDALMDSVKKRASGTTFKEISGSEFGSTLVPIPPILEQIRISPLVESTVDTLN